MINTLHLKNIGIIDEITIDFNKGLNVLTGETGAGKSLIIDSIAILSGGRVLKEIIRKGANYSFVEASIYLPKEKLSQDNYVIVSREIYLTGKNICKINGRLVTVNELKEFMQNVVDIHGQNDNQKLMRSGNHIEFLDNYSNIKILTLKKEYESLYNEYLELKENLKKNYGNERERKRTLDLLNYEFDEIKEASLKDGEEDILQDKRKLIQNSEKIYSTLVKSEKNLSQNVLSSLQETIHDFSKISDINIIYKDIFTRLNDSYYDLEDILLCIEEKKADIFFDENSANEICNRLDIIYNLKRKYGNSISEILEYCNNLEIKINEINNLEQYIENINFKLDKVKSKMFQISKSIHEVRVNESEKLEININHELEDLEMKNAKFKVNIEFDINEEYTKNGLDKIEFLISTNIGEDFKPLIKVASGGELSRIMLAIKTVLAVVDEVPIMIFDEIDTGIGGRAAKAVSQKIRKISTTHQILCVTHLAVVAAHADYNYNIVKKVEGGKTNTYVEILDEKRVIEEIARMASGEINQVTIEHAMLLRKQRVA
ncbi:MAG: DNA repair protein RecN [Clostridia bacterium]